jgi:hypothetical protein
MYYPTVPGPAGKSAGADWDGWAWIGQPARRRLQEAGAPAGYGSYGGTITGTCTAVLAGARPPMSSARQDRASCKSESEGNSRRRGFAQSQASQRHHPGSPFGCVQACAAFEPCHAPATACSPAPSGTPRPAWDQEDSDRRSAASRHHSKGPGARRAGPLLVSGCCTAASSGCIAGRAAATACRRPESQAARDSSREQDRPCRAAQGRRSHPSGSAGCRDAGPGQGAPAAGLPVRVDGRY